VSLALSLEADPQATTPELLLYRPRSSMWHESSVQQYSIWTSTPDVPACGVAPFLESARGSRMPHGLRPGEGSSELLDGRSGV
jgi:hypothetical protein